MTSKDIWYGMPLSAGIQEQIMSLLWGEASELPQAEIADKLDLKPASVSAAMSNLKHAGWVTFNRGLYRASDPRPIEDKSRVHQRLTRPGSRHKITHGSVTLGKVGDEFLLEIILVDEFGPVLQDDDTRYLYRIKRVEIR